MQLPATRNRLFSLATILLALLALPLGGCFGGGDADPYSKRYSSGQINANPALLDSTIVKGSDLSGLRLENRVVRNATLLNTSASGAYLKNVVFDNCRLINAKFDRSVLENVTFKGGVITCERDADNLPNRSRFTNSQFTNLVLDGVYLENAVFDGFNSSIAVRNAHHILAETPLFTGYNMALTLQNSLFRNMVIGKISGNSSLTAINCTFYYATFGNSVFQNVTMRKNITYGDPIIREEKTPRQSRRRQPQPNFAPERL